MKSLHVNVCAAAALLLALPACQGPKHPPVWTESVVTAPSENILWAVASQELQRMGFPLGVGADPSQLVMSSGWKTQLRPFKGEGYRERAEVRFTAREAGRFAIEARIEKEFNDDLVRPLDPSHAQWKPAPDNVEAAQILLQRIDARLGNPIEIGAPATKRRGG